MAARYWVGGGLSTNWNATGNTNWSTTSGGANNASIPTTSDDVFFDGVGASANGTVTINVALAVISITFTGYTGNVVMSNTFTITGNFTDSTNHTYSGSGVMNINGVGATITITSNGRAFSNQINLGGSGTNTYTLNGDWTTGAINVGSVGTKVFNRTAAGDRWISTNGITLNAAISGNLNFRFTGGTFTGSQSQGLNVTGTTTLAGNVTIGTNFTFQSGTLVWESGTVTQGVGNTFILGSCTLDTAGATFRNITLLNGPVTITINSLLTISTTLASLTGVGGYTFAGTAGFICSVFSMSQVSVNTITFKEGVTYTITGSITASTSSVGSKLVFTSSSATVKTIINLYPEATCNILADFTRVDASGGAPIWTFNGTVTSCNNVFTFNNLSFTTQKVNICKVSNNY